MQPAPADLAEPKVIEAPARLPLSRALRLPAARPEQVPQLVLAQLVLARRVRPPEDQADLGAKVHRAVQVEAEAAILDSALRRSRPW